MPEVGEVSVAAEKEVASHKETTDQLHPDHLRWGVHVCVYASECVSLCEHLHTCMHGSVVLWYRLAAINVQHTIQMNVKASIYNIRLILNYGAYL